MFGWIRRRQPRLVHTMIGHFLDGAAMGCMFGLVLYHTNTAGLGGLLESPQNAGAAALFLAQGALIFGTLGVAVGAMSLGREND
jgi:hypothetical protein